MTASSSLDTPAMEPLGDQGLVIVLGAHVHAEVNRRACALAALIDAEARANRLRGVVDVVPSFTTVAVHYRAELVTRKQGESAYEAMRRRLATVVASMPASAWAGDSTTSDVVEIPVCFGGVHGPDLEEAASRCGLDAATLMSLHLQPQPVRVYMLGFAPGAPYIGQFDARVSLPRRSTPRVRVPRGSIGIANRQAVVYPVEGPGGWHLIGRTPLTLFDPSRARPSLLEPGSLVRFKAIDEDTLLSWPRA